MPRTSNMQKSAELSTSSLKEMLRLCQDLQKLLKEDKNHFSNNDLTLLTASNQKKAAALEQLNILIKDLNITHHSSGLLSQIEEATKNLNSTQQKEITSIINELKSEVAKCNQHIATNSHIVFNGIQYIKNLWDRLMACRKDTNCVYDHKGSTK